MKGEKILAVTSERIIILSAIVLVIIAWLPNSGLIQTIVTIDDVEVEIDTSRDYYYLGDSFTANVYLVNNRSKDVWMEPVSSFSFSGVSENDPASGLVVDVTDNPEGRLHIPTQTKVLLIDQLFMPNELGEFTITCLGARKKVLIIESQSENEKVNAMMNKHSFKKTDEATLFITNVGLNTITIVDPYEIQNKDGDLWVKVSPSDYRDVWLDYLLELDSGGIFRQQVEIDRLEAGMYRISKEIYTDFPQEHFTLFVEFEIQESREKEYAWVTATVLTVDPSPTLNIIELSSEDSDIPRSLFKAIDKALLDHESVHEKEPSIYPHESRRFAMPIDEAEAIIHYFGVDIEEDRNAYEFYVSFLDYVISILIQFSIQVTS